MEKSKAIKSSSSYYGEIELETYKNEFHPEDLVTGKIYLNLKHDFPAKSLFLKIKGYEETYFYPKSSHSQSMLKKTINSLNESIDSS